MVGVDRPGWKLGHITAVGVVKRSDGAVQLDGEIELSRVAVEVGDHLVAGRLLIEVAGERQTRHRVVSAGCKQHQRIPSLCPRRSDLIGCVDDQEANTGLPKVVPQRQPGLTGTDHEHVVAALRIAFGVGRWGRLSLGQRYRDTWEPVRTAATTAPIARALTAA